MNDMNQLTASYDALETLLRDPLVIPLVNHTSCAESILSDSFTVSMDTVNAYYIHARNVWTMANCDNCYDSKSKKFTDDVAKFFGDKYRFDYCVDASLNGSCDRCSSLYSSLNIFYEEIEQEYSGNLCLDLRQDMERVRGRWSALGCIVPIGYDLLVLSAASGVILLTLLIYVASSRMSTANSTVTAIQKRLSSQLDIQSANNEETTHLLGEHSKRGSHV